MVELILTCINLLLSDLDKEKARNLLTADQEAYLRRRNEYAEEKLEFLGFCAVRLLLLGRTAFSSDFIEKNIKEYFQTESTSLNAKNILHDTRNFAYQLIFSGLFVMVDRVGDEISYDLPHRRFREVLAAQHFNSLTDRTSLLEAFLDRSDLVEILLLFSNRPDEVLRAILDRSLKNKNKQYNSAIVSLSKRPHPDFNRTISEALTKSIDLNEVLPAAVAVLPLFEPDGAFIVFLTSSLESSFLNRKINALLLCCFLIRHYSPSTFREWIDRKLRSLDPRDEQIWLILMAHAVMSHPAVFLRNVENMKCDPSLLEKLCYAAVHGANQINDKAERIAFYTDLLATLTSSQSIAFFYFLAKDGRFRLSEMKETIMQEDQERYASIVRSVVEFGGNQSVDARYVVTGEMLKRIIQEDQFRKQWDAQRWTVHLTQDFGGSDFKYKNNILKESQISSDHFESLCKIISKVSYPAIKTTSFEDVVA